MRKLLLLWIALTLALGPVAGAFAAPMPYIAGSNTEEHCMGHESEGGPSQDMRMDCCDSEYDRKQCCDHCVTPVSALLNNNPSLTLNSLTDPVIVFVQPALSATHSPPYKPPQA